LIVLFGIIGYTYLGVREFPNRSRQVSIRTNYTGANADIIESQITEPLEKQSILLTVRNITSSSAQGSSITVEFNLDKDLKKLPMMLEIKCLKRFVVYLKILMLHQ
jgi:HAE1 family hydrophobic/amphiphilic exporter-1/multidrug efflux pump